MERVSGEGEGLFYSTELEDTKIGGIVRPKIEYSPSRRLEREREELSI